MWRGRLYLATAPIGSLTGAGFRFGSTTGIELPELGPLFRLLNAILFLVGASMVHAPSEETMFP